MVLTKLGTEKSPCRLPSSFNQLTRPDLMGFPSRNPVSRRRRDFQRLDVNYHTNITWVLARSVKPQQYYCQRTSPTTSTYDWYSSWRRQYFPRRECLVKTPIAATFLPHLHLSRNASWNPHHHPPHHDSKARRMESKGSQGRLSRSRISRRKCWRNWLRI